MSVEDKNEIDSNHDNTLSKEDMKRVSRYLSSPLNKIERKPFQSQCYVHHVDFHNYFFRE